MTKKTKSKSKTQYRASSIEVLEGLDPVRRRPGMYIGGTEGKGGLHHLVKEILDNSIDEAMNGYASEIKVILHKDQKSITVTDNGRGIPVDKHPQFKKPALEIILTTLHAGGKFSEQNYASAGGLHGVGSSVVNALSEWLRATVWRDGYEWSQEFSRGKATSKLQKGKKTKKTGTEISFRPDPEIFRETEFSAKLLEQTIQQKAFLNKNIKLSFTDEKAGKTQEFQYKDGIQSFLQHELKKGKAAPVNNEVFFLEQSEGVRIEVAFCWTESTNSHLLSFVNGIPTAEGGSHVDGFRDGLGKAIRNYISVHESLPKGVKLSGEDIREGLFTILSVNVPGAVSQLQFQGQTKDKLNNPEVTLPVDNLVRGFEKTLNENPRLASVLVERIIRAARARAAARMAAQQVSRKSSTQRRLNLPGKLADCSSTAPAKCEIFIVEGDSAGGTAKQARDRGTQAILPLRGKILNAISAPGTKLKENRELSDLVSALGCGMGEHCNPKKLRYGKVVILTDADSDGMHIAALLMAFFFTLLRPLVEGGHLYLGLSPLYRIRVGAGEKQENMWVYSDEEKEEILKKIGKKKFHITRFKGLGEMDSAILWKTTLNPKTRNLLRIQVDDALEAQDMLQRLLGKSSEDRYRLIQENAHRLEVDL